MRAAGERERSMDGQSERHGATVSSAAALAVGIVRLAPCRPSGSLCNHGHPVKFLPRLLLPCRNHRPRRPALSLFQPWPRPCSHLDTHPRADLNQSKVAAMARSQDPATRAWTASFCLLPVLCQSLRLTWDHTCRNLSRFETLDQKIRLLQRKTC